jgi:NADP-dependent 3-hydroxy acid dehydrogenase YdfG
MELRNKVALITGATGGIGEAVARNLDEAGVRLILTGRSEEKLKKLANELRAADYVAGEVTDAGLPDRLVNHALEKFKGLDVVFSNAGVMNVGAIEDVDIEKICEMVRINVESVYRLGYTVLRHFKKQGSGYLIHTSSISGLKTDATLGAYSGTKFAVEAFTDALRMELAGTNIGVACVAPGPVETGLFNHWSNEQKDFIAAEGKLQPEDIARAVRFILEQPAHVRVPRMLVVPSTLAAD